MNQLLPKLDVDQHNEIIIFGFSKTQYDEYSFLTALKFINIKFLNNETESMQSFEKEDTT